MLRRSLAVTLMALLALPLHAAQPQFWTLETARDFQEGDAEGVSIDSVGRLRLAPVARSVFDTETPYVWSLARDAKGVLYAGTGNDGKVFRIDGGQGRLLYDAPELEVHALAAGRDGKLYVGSSPDGKVYAVDGNGAAATFYDAPDRYIWALALDRAGNLIVATGLDGRVIRVDAAGQATVLLTSPESHITALAVDDAGVIYAGSAPGGILYRIEGTRVSVIHDSPFREIKALAVGSGGAVYAAVIDSRTTSDTPPMLTPAPTPSPAAPAGEVTVTESFTVIVPQSTSTSSVTTTSSSSSTASRAGTPKGALLRVMASGEVDMLWSSTEETPFAVVARERSVLLGTGAKGRVYEVRDDTTWTMVSDFTGEQITAMVPTSSGALALSTSNPGRVHALEGGVARKGTLTSKVKDTDAASSWGRLRWEATAPSGTAVTLESRSGNTTAPDTTWTDWSKAYTSADGQPMVDPAGRFLQLRATLTGPGSATPVVESITAAYLQRNLRPDMAGITVHPPGEVFQRPLSVTGEADILGLEPGASPPSSQAQPATPRQASAPLTTYARKMYQKGLQTLSWKAEDANGDILAYDVDYRPADADVLRPLRRNIDEPVIALDTTTIPNGRYVLRVTVTDEPANPKALALTAFDESAPFDVDNTAPSVTVARVDPTRVRATVRDEDSRIRRAEFSVDGSTWQEVHPVDGISDGTEEAYEVAIPTTGPAPHIVVVRAFDMLGNVATGRTQIP